MDDIFLEKIVGSKAKVRILSFLYNFTDLDYSISYIAKECKISWNTSNKQLKEFAEIGLIKKTRSKGNQIYYKAIRYKIATAFIKLEDETTNFLRSLKHTPNDTLQNKSD